MGNSLSSKVVDVIRHPRIDGELLPLDLVEQLLPPGTTPQDSNREFVTIIECIYADGSSLDPAVIFKAQNQQDTWYQNIENVPHNVLFGVFPNGWTDSSKALAYLHHKFGPASRSAQKAAGRWRVLTFDGHSSHLSDELLMQCLEWRVFPICRPPHTSHFTCPLDVSVFSVYKRRYSDILMARMEKGLRGVWKGNFYEILMEAREEAFSAAIISGFKHTGLYPVDGNLVISKLREQARAIAQEISSSHLADGENPDSSGTSVNTTHNSPQPPPPSTPTKPLYDLAPHVVYGLQTPQSAPKLEFFKKLVSVSYKDREENRWREKPILQKLIRAQETSQMEVDFLQKRLEDQKRKFDETRAELKRPKKRTKIPQSGNIL